LTGIELPTMPAVISDETLRQVGLSRPEAVGKLGRLALLRDLYTEIVGPPADRLS
jgi:hypothetical protein